jgi:hypothetical protein
MVLQLRGIKRPVEAPKGSALRPIGLWVGKGSSALEVAVYDTTHQPGAVALQEAWLARVGGRATPVLVAATYAVHGDTNRVALCGPTGEKPPVYPDLDPEVVTRILETALEEGDRHSALRFLRYVLPTVQETTVPGVRNEGFLSTHELEEGVPHKVTWDDYAQQAAPAYRKRGKDLVQALGFTVQEATGSFSVLLAGPGPRKVAIAAFLERDETPEASSNRFHGHSPISAAMARADAENLPYVVVTSGSSIRLYPTRTGVGVGQRGRTETFVEAHLGILPEDKAAYLWYLFSADALREGGVLQELLETSRDHAADLGKRLRERVYQDVVPGLATAIARTRGLRKPSAEQLEETYQIALLLLFRLLFVAYAEDKDLLPYRSNEMYRERSLKRKARALKALAESNTMFDESATHWTEAFHLFEAVDEGRPEWGVPAYNGGLFSSDAAIAPLGALLKDLRLSNKEFGPLLRALLLDSGKEGLGPVDFRSLGVREFGTIYEGLLESELGVAEVDLTLDRAGVYKPAKARDDIAVRKGQYYLSTTSGARKSSGSYFTKAFAVEHLLDHALEPALDAHLARLDRLEDARAAESFLDFRVADIAMGSGHFLVAAVDRIEKRLSGYLAKRPLPQVAAELHRLRSSALEALGLLAAGVELEDGQLLRRQIARRCIYGVDLKPAAVDLARVSLWIHTFVAGLPLSLLDQHLVRGDSLVGIATADEAVRLLEGVGDKPAKKGVKPKGKPTKATTLFDKSARKVMGDIAEDMMRVARLGDATAAEVRQARKAWEKAKKEAEPWRVLMDVLAAARLDEKLRTGVPVMVDHWKDDPKGILGSWHQKRAAEVLGALRPLHFLVAFPEVFWRGERPGFDVILGNPPWEEATVEEDKFWTRIEPGLSGLEQHEQEALKKRLRRERPDLVQRLDERVAVAERLRAALTAGDFPGMGTGDPDLFKAFCWRFWHLLARAGRLGVVLPRSAFVTKGSAEFRRRFLREGTLRDLTFLLNKKEWVFDGVEERYRIGLFCVEKTSPTEDALLPLRGPFSSLTRFREGLKRPPVGFLLGEVLSWTDTAALPMLPNEDSLDTFVQLRKAPRLDRDAPGEWRARPYAELHATNDKKENGGIITFPAQKPRGHWPVFKGESFDTWESDTGTYYGWVEPKEAKAYLQAKRMNARSAFDGFPEAWLKDPKTLPCLVPRIAFRDVARADDTRTVRSALLPPNVAVTNQAPTVLWQRGDEKDQAFLLAALCSIPLDWYARRFVETHVNYHVFNPLPVPRPPRSSPLWKRAVALAGRLATVDDRYADWAAKVGVGHGPLELGQKEAMIRELDAVVARLYGLTETQLTHIFETFHEGWEYKARLEATLGHFRKLDKSQAGGEA